MQIEQIIDVDKFVQEIEEDITDVTEAMRKQTARAAYYGMLHAKSKRQSAKVSLTVKTIEAALNTKYRKKLSDAAVEIAEADGSKPEKITVDMVKSAVAVDGTMLKLLQNQMEADEIETICRVAYDAFRTRRDMLVSLGLITRDSMKVGMQIQSARQEASGYKQRRAARRGEVAEEEVAAE